MFTQKSVRLVIVGVCVLAVLLGGWAAVSRARSNRSQAQDQSAGQDQVGPEKKSEQRTLKVGEAFELRLDANATTGYAWEVAELDESKVRLVANDYVEGATSGQVVGAGGQSVLRFEAVAKGQTRIKLVYRRAWETGVEPIKTYTVELTVQ